jgi:oligoribonuclease (3'-5' exoribonuclease)
MKHLITLDTETEGLDPSKHRILEIAMVAVQLPTFEIVAEFSQCVHVDLPGHNLDPYVVRMHQDSGLWRDCIASPHSLEQVQAAACAFVDQHTEGDGPLGAINAPFRRAFLEAQMPMLARRFHRTNFEITTLLQLDDWVLGENSGKPPRRAGPKVRSAVRAVELHYERMAAAYGAK